MVRAVLFDVAGTLAMPRARAGEEALDAAGRPGGPYPSSVPDALADAYAARDLDPDAHRAAYVGLLSTVVAPAAATAVYERILVPDGWVAYPDAAPTLAALRARGIRTAAVSNVGYDLRPVLDGLGLLEHLDAVVLSCEVGAIKPDPAIFLAALRAVGVAPAEALMVGDHPTADGGAADCGIRTLLLPMSPAGADHGLGAALALV
jgi:HAD superfamily hydrolase (TIGR01509 family)